jgi:hypothetical protein
MLPSVGRDRPWRERYGRLPTSYDWSRTHARRRGKDVYERLAEGEWPAASVVTRLLGIWSAARAMAAERIEEMKRETALAASWHVLCATWQSSCGRCPAYSSGPSR